MVEEVLPQVELKIRRTIEERVINATLIALVQNNYVSLMEVFIRIGFLQLAQVNLWKTCQIPYLELGINVGKDKIKQTKVAFTDFITKQNLISQEIKAWSITRHHRELQFSKDGSFEVEHMYRLHYLNNKLAVNKQQNILAKLIKLPELVVFQISKDSQCSVCQQELSKSSLLFMEIGKPLCLKCAGLDHLSFLSSGDASVTLKAKQYSSLVAMVVKFSSTRKRYERQGILIEQTALQRAKNEKN